MRNMSERISWLTSRVGSMSSTHLEDRLYAVLTTVAREHGTLTEGGLVMEESGLSRVRFDAIDRRCAEGMTPDAYCRVYWTMVLPIRV